ncbi:MULTISPECIES: YhcG family protein [Streptacidiphilus]|uniref:YhcG family protein n=1 Tax=Streptacidiphilus cavernicola TaxID=3342716 RepID=A0ABV6UV45_9ACTN|nr:PDDEXK nuclease domain-containing protein [Streptacidiphilus jeojiense]
MPTEDLPVGYADLLHDIKSEITSARIRAHRAVNTEQIELYWRIGRLILTRQEKEGWGAQVVDRLAADLRTTHPGQRGFGRSNLQYMLKMARTWPEPIVQQPVGQLPWGHITVLLDKTNTPAELDFYTRSAVQHGWSRAMLQHWITSGLHLSQGAAQTNFATTVIPEQSDAVRELVKDPYRLEFLGLDGDHAERDFEDALVARLIEFLTELGVGFSFVGRQYRVLVGGEEFRIDLLFYHCKLHRYVVFELKTRTARPEHVGKLGFYVAVVDDLVRDKERDDETIGILLSAGRNHAAVEYALQNHNRPLAVSSYVGLPRQVRELLPSSEDLARVAQGVLEQEAQP